MYGMLKAKKKQKRKQREMDPGNIAACELPASKCTDTLPPVHIWFSMVLQVKGTASSKMPTDWERAKLESTKEWTR